jgi:hypothetical protein
MKCFDAIKELERNDQQEEVSSSKHVGMRDRSQWFLVFRSDSRGADRKA